MHEIKDIQNVFLISIEVLNYYNFNADYSDYIYEKYLENNTILIFLIKFNNILIDRKYFKQHKFLDNIQLIYFIHHKKYRHTLKLIAYKILKNITTHNKPYLQRQYIQKFTYIYYRHCKYYNISSYYSQPEIHKIAIQSLYFITQLDNSDSIYLITKYINK